VKRVAVFGNAGGGKSTLARKLAERARLPLYVVDMMQRFSAADTLIYVDLPFFVHFLWITKRLLKGLFATPSGCPRAARSSAARSAAIACFGYAIGA